MLGVILGLVVVAAISISFYVYLRQRILGTLDISTESVAYDHDKYGHLLNWDKHCFYIRGEPILLISGEFHYWRLPDRNRWRSVLETYKSAGLNCLRIYFHWGFHSCRNDD